MLSIKPYAIIIIEKAKRSKINKLNILFFLRNLEAYSYINLNLLRRTKIEKTSCIISLTFTI